MLVAADQKPLWTRRPSKRSVSTPCVSGSRLINRLQRIEHAGYHRYILQRNPARYDPDGDIVEPGDEYEDEDDLSTVEENPYAEIRLESTWTRKPPKQELD
jgi:hypothetical protein